MSNVSRSEAVEQLHEIIMEARAYAGLHDLNFVSMYERDDDNITMISHSNRPAMFQFWGAITRHMEPDLVMDFDSSQPEPAESPEPRKQWSVLWGLFTRYY